jgi:hypothetical protein
VWGIPWKSSIPFKGLAYTVGGRSVYWGGWSPRLLDAEVTTWPAQTVADLKTRYFGESTRQIGVDETNDFIFGELHNALRQRLFDNLGATAAVKSLGTDVPTLVGLLVCLIPTTIGALLAAIGIAGMDRALRANILSKSGKAVEVAGDVDTLLLDKTGTITVGNRRATQFLPLGGYAASDLGRLAAMASIADQTPEGKSIVDLYQKLPGEGTNRLAAVGAGIDALVPDGSKFIEFTAQTRMSGVDLADGRRIRKGAPDSIIKYVQQTNGHGVDRLQQQIDEVASKGATPLLVCEGSKIAGLVVLEDILKPGMRDRFERLRRMGLRTVMVTGDNPLTAKAIAEQAGVDAFIAQATPEAKLEYIRKEQASGKLVAMMGDGTNDAPALALQKQIAIGAIYEFPAALHDLVGGGVARQRHSAHLGTARGSSVRRGLSRSRRAARPSCRRPTPCNGSGRCGPSNPGTTGSCRPVRRSRWAFRD